MARHLTETRKQDSRSALYLSKTSKVPPTRRILTSKTTNTQIKAISAAEYQKNHHPGSNDAFKHLTTKRTVSTAGIFKKAKAASREKQHRKRKELSPPPLTTLDNVLLNDFKDGLQEAGDALLNDITKTFDDTLQIFTTQLSESRIEDDRFIKGANAIANLLTEPLTADSINVVFNKDGKSTEETVNMGDCISKFKASVNQSQNKLKELWKQWDEVQNEYIELGVEVFGADKFGEDAKVVKGGRERSYRREMELVGLEGKMRVGELEGEIEEMGVRYLQKMKTSEKDLDVKAKEATTKLIKAIIED